MSGTNTTSWLTRLRPLSDSPLENINGDLFDLGAHVRLLVEAVLTTDGPLIVHVDGAWGRGKTSFCRLVEQELSVGRWCNASEIKEAQPGQRVSVRGFLRTSPTLTSTSALVVEVDGAAVEIIGGYDLSSFLDGDEVVVTGVGRDSTTLPTISASRISRAYAYCSRYIASDDDGPASRSLLFSVAKAIAGPDDPEEAARIVRQWSADGEHSAMRMDGFATWLSHELGRITHHRRSSIINIPLDAGNERVLRLELRANPRRSAVVFIDDLDRCHRDRVVEILEGIRRYVACLGLVFVIAADRRLIEQAFEAIVDRDLDRRRTNSAEAMEKYIHRRIELPSFAGFGGSELAARLFSMQSELVPDPNLLLLSIPTAMFEQGVALPLAQVFGASLTPRRLKRILNDFAIDIAEFIDRTRAHAGLDSRESWRALWADDDPNMRLAVSSTESSTLPQYFVGRLLLRVAEHMWPSLFAHLDLHDDEFERRCDRLLALARVHTEWNSSAAKRMRDELLRDLDPDGTTPLRVRRQLCEFMVWVINARRELAMDLADIDGSELDFETRSQYALPSPVSDNSEQRSPVEPAVSLREPISSSTGSPTPQRPIVAMPVNTMPAKRYGPPSYPAPLSSEEYNLFIDEVDRDFGRYVDHKADLDTSAREQALIEILTKLEILIETPHPSERLSQLIHVVTGEVLEISTTETFAGLRACASIANEHEHFLWGRKLYMAAAQAARAIPALSHIHALATDLGYASFVLHMNFLDEHDSFWKLEHIITRGSGDEFIPDETLSEFFIIAAELVHKHPGRDYVWKPMLHEYRERVEAGFDEGDLKSSREYIKLLRAGGWDDPNLDTLFGPDATWRESLCSEPEVTQALADIFVRRNTPDGYRYAKALYLELRGTPMWTPQVLHNLATAENALDPEGDAAGGLWLQAHRLLPGDPVFRRALSRFLRARGYVKEAIMVSRGDPLPAHFAPFEEPLPSETEIES